MGRVTAPFGVTGWIRIQPFTESPDGLLAYPVWWLGSGSEWKQYPVAHARVRGRAVVAKLEGCDDRDCAAALRGREVAVPRVDLPPPAENEWYWADLIGLTVVNTTGETLGTLSGILRTGANDVLVVEGGRERLLPFIAEVVRKVDLERGVVRVEWSADY